MTYSGLKDWLHRLSPFGSRSLFIVIMIATAPVMLTWWLTEGNSGRRFNP